MACAGAVASSSLLSWLTGSQRATFLKNGRGGLSQTTSLATSWVVSYCGGERSGQRQEAAITVSKHSVLPGDTWLSKLEGSE